MQSNTPQREQEKERRGNGSSDDVAASGRVAESYYVISPVCVRSRRGPLFERLGDENDEPVLERLDVEQPTTKRRRLLPAARSLDLFDDDHMDAEVRPIQSPRTVTMPPALPSNGGACVSVCHECSATRAEKNNFDPVNPNDLLGQKVQKSRNH